MTEADATTSVAVASAVGSSGTQVGSSVVVGGAGSTGGSVAICVATGGSVGVSPSARADRTLNKLAHTTTIKNRETMAKFFLGAMKGVSFL